MQNRLASLVLLLTCGLSVSSVLAQEPVLLEDIEKGWKTKTINNVVNGSFSVMLERFDQTCKAYQRQDYDRYRDNDRSFFILHISIRRFISSP